MNRDEIIGWLRERDESRVEELRALADKVRRENVGDDVHLRGLIEFSNECVRGCLYCGLRVGNKKLKRYRMTKDEVLDCAAEAQNRGYGTIVLQSGEDERMSREWIGEIVAAIKSKYDVAITLGVGERPLDEYRYWFDKGADRVLLKFETSDKELYRRIHPPLKGKNTNRIEMLKSLREIGYQIGAGGMIGTPGQTYESLARDIEIFGELDADMIGVGPYIPNPDTPMGAECLSGKLERANNQVPNDEITTLKAMALTRIVCPQSNIPATTALATLDKEGWIKGLQFGANVIMPNLTPYKYRSLYEIYPNPFHQEDINTKDKVVQSILAAGRKVAAGHGDRKLTFSFVRKKK